MEDELALRPRTHGWFFLSFFLIVSAILSATSVEATDESSKMSTGTFSYLFVKSEFTFIKISF